MTYQLLKLYYSFNGWAVTMVDSLDTMYLMGLDKEFKRGLDLVKQTAYAKHNVGSFSLAFRNPDFAHNRK